MADIPLTPARVSDVQVSQANGPWPSKCGGELNVPLMLSQREMGRFFNFDPAELEQSEVDIRGIRVFYIHGAVDGGMAGNQFHRIRTECAFVIKGLVHWEFMDLYGGRRTQRAGRECMVQVPPFILHRATFGPGGGTLATLANTIYVREDPRTHDTYSLADFHKLADQFRAHADAR